jgi:hypothetical protein
MRIMRLAFVALATCGLWAGVQPCSADTAGIGFTSPGTVTPANSQFTYGYEFQVNHNSNIIVDRLGLFDDGSSADIGTSNTVGLWDSNQNLLASASVSSSGIQDGSFLYATIPDVTLSAGQDYYVAAITNGGVYTQTTTGFAAAPQITFLNSAFAETGSFSFPLQSDGANGYFGGNFEFVAAAPLPSTLTAGLLALGALGCWMIARRWKAAAE